MVHSNSGGKLFGSGTTNPKGNLRSTPFLRKLRKAYYGFHILSLVIGCVVIFLGIWVTHVEKMHLKDLKMESISRAYIDGYYVAGACIIVAGILGGLALVKDNKPYLWVLYTMLMAVVCLVLLTVSISALTKSVERSIDKKLRNLTEQYVESPKTDSDRQAISVVDDYQEHNECCGIESYKDWQDVTFGKTSLRVPQSCCNINSTNGIRLNRANMETLTANNTELAEDYKYCGHLCLPDSDNLEVIFTRGCKEPLASELKTVIIAIGAFGFISSILTGGLFLLSCYLVVWKKV